jgi:hypothetical protein
LQLMRIYAVRAASISFAGKILHEMSTRLQL